LMNHSPCAFFSIGNDSFAMIFFSNPPKRRATEFC
jgi:hypothetical protein